MKRFLIVLLVVLVAIAILAACAPVSHAPADDADAQPTGIVEYTKTISDELLPGNAIPTWVIIAVAIIVFLIGFGLIWKLIPGFIKFIAIIVLAGAIAGAAYGLWTIPAVDKLKETYEDLTSPSVTQELDE